MTLPNLPVDPVLPRCPACGGLLKIVYRKVVDRDPWTLAPDVFYEARCATYSGWKPWTWVHGEIFNTHADSDCWWNRSGRILAARENAA